MIVIHRCPSLDEAYQDAKSLLVKEIEERLKKEVPLLVLLSGGSNIETVRGFKNLFSHPLVTSTVLDERWSKNPTTNNALQLQATGLDIQVFTPSEQETVRAFGERFEVFLKTWRQQHQEGQVIATLGVGADGHIAGISPLANENEFVDLFLETEHWAVGYEGNLTPPARVTVTGFFLDEMLDVGVGVVSQSKQQAFMSLENDMTKAHQVPLILLQSTSAQCHFFTEDFEVFPNS